ncbi:MAG: hypothetical protein PHC38_12950, partial [Weeksellaceae bacterium]|nr:hypothetical protein [Weeksellaceae bacterium]
WLNKNTAGQIQIGQHKRSIFSLFKAQRLIDLLIDTWQNKKVGEELIVGCLNIVNKHSVEFPDYSVDRFIEFCNKNIHHATE